MFLAGFSVRFWLESGKMCKNTPTYFIFTIVCRYSLFFSPGRDQLLGRAGQENISALYMSFGSQGWTALLELVDTAGPNV